MSFVTFLRPICISGPIKDSDPFAEEKSFPIDANSHTKGHLPNGVKLNIFVVLPNSFCQIPSILVVSLYIELPTLTAKNYQYFGREWSTLCHIVCKSYHYGSLWNSF